jgi:hypothetical protein
LEAKTAVNAERINNSRLGPRSFEPDLNLVAIRIGDVSVRDAGSELTTTEQASSGAFDLSNGTVDVARLHQPKTEMCDAAAETGPGWVLDEGEDVVPARSLGVDEPISTPVLAQTKNLLVEPQRASQVPDGEIDVRKAVSPNHNHLEFFRGLTVRMSYRRLEKDLGQHRRLAPENPEAGGD